MTVKIVGAKACASISGRDGHPETILGVKMICPNVTETDCKESVMNTIRKRAIKYAKEENDHYLVVDDNTVVREGSHRLHNLVDNVPSDMGLIIASSVIPSKDILCELDYCFILGKSSVLALLGSSIPNVGTMRSYESLVIDSKAVCMGVYKAMLPTSA